MSNRGTTSIPRTADISVVKGTELLLRSYQPRTESRQAAGDENRGKKQPKALINIGLECEDTFYAIADGFVFEGNLLSCLWEGIKSSSVTRAPGSSFMSKKRWQTLVLEALTAIPKAAASRLSVTLESLNKRIPRKGESSSQTISKLPKPSSVTLNLFPREPPFSDRNNESALKESEHWGALQTTCQGWPKTWPVFASNTSQIAEKPLTDIFTNVRKNPVLQLVAM